MKEIEITKTANGYTATVDGRKVMYCSWVHDYSLENEKSEDDIFLREATFITKWGAKSMAKQLATASSKPYVPKPDRVVETFSV